MFDDVSFVNFRRRCSLSRDALEIRRPLPEDRSAASVTEAICVTKHKTSAELLSLDLDLDYTYYLRVILLRVYLSETYLPGRDARRNVEGHCF